MLKNEVGDKKTGQGWAGEGEDKGIGCKSKMTWYLQMNQRVTGAGKNMN